MQVWFSFFEEKKEKTDFIKENQFSHWFLELIT